MNFLLMGLTALILIHSQLSLASEKSCNEIIETVNEISFTEDFWAYLKELIQDKILTKDQLEIFYQSLIRGKLINPIPHQMTNLGPVFNNTSDMLHYKRIAQYVETSQSLDLGLIKNKLEAEFKNIKSIQNKKNIVSDKTKISMIREKFIELITHDSRNLLSRNDLYKKSIIEVFNDNAVELSNFAKELWNTDSSSQMNLGLDIYLKLNQLDSYFNLIKENIDNYYLFKINESEFKKLINPIEYIRKATAISLEIITSNPNNPASEDIYKNLAELYSYLDQNQSENVTNYFKEILNSPDDYITFLAHHYYIKRSTVNGLELAKKILEDDSLSDEFLTYVVSAISYNKSDLAVEFMHQIFDDKNIPAIIKEYLFFGLDDNPTQLQFSLIKKGIEFRVPNAKNFRESIIISAFYALSKSKGPEAFEIIKSIFNQAVKRNLIENDFIYFELLRNRPEREVYDLLLPYLNSNRLDFKIEAIDTISSLNYADIRESIIQFVLQSNNLHYISHAIFGIGKNNSEFLLPMINYYKDKYEVPEQLFITLRGRTDQIVLEFAIQQLKNPAESPVVESLKIINVFQDSIKLPILHDFISKQLRIDLQAEALELLYGKLDQKSLELLSNALKSRNFNLVRASLPGYLYAILVGNVESLQTDASIKLVLESIEIIQKH